MKPADFIQAPHAVEGVEVTRVACGELACFQIAAAQVCVAKCLRTLAGEEVKPQPPPIGARDSLSLSKKGDKQKKNEIRIYLRLQLKIASEIFRCDLARAAFELKRGVQRMIEFLDEHNQRSDIAITQARARIVLFELFDQPARIINADVKLVAGLPQKCARQLAQFAGGLAGQHRQLHATRPINQAILQIDPNLRVRSLE